VKGAAARAVVLVEGISDQRALETLAERRGRDLDVEGVRIVPIGGAHAIGRFLARFGRVADPDEQAAASVFLASDAGNDINGAILPVDNGWFAV
jgi:predicted ATP-dependent endonuclease of OLD family